MMILPSLITVALALQSVQTLHVPSNYLTQKPSLETVLAKVDGVPIKANDVERLLWDWRGYETMQDLITYQLIHARAAKLSIVVTPAEIQKAFDDIVKEQSAHLPAGQDFDTFLRQQHNPKSRLFMQVESNLLLSRIVDKQFNPSEFFKVSTLIFKPKTKNGSDILEAAGKAQDAYNRLVKGEDWSKVMNTSSQDPLLVQNKGLLGWRRLDAFPADTAEELKKLKPGGLTKTVETDNGIQLFRLEAVGTSVTGTELAELRQLYEQNAKGKLIEGLEKAAKVERFYGAPTKK